MSSGFEPRFGHAAREFDRYRPDYPPELFEHILSAIPKDRRDRAMDLGAGTGKSTRPLLAHFREVIAVEPDAGMAAKLKQEIPHVTVLTTTVEACEQPELSVNLITIANALHWMDFTKVFAYAWKWLRAGGILAVYDRPLPKATEAIDRIVLAELRGPWKPHRDPRLKRDLHWEKEVRAAAGFEVSEEAKFSHILPISPRDYAGFWRSTSYGSAYALTLTDPEGYWLNLESRFAEAAAGGEIPVDLSPTLVLARKV